MPCIPAIFTCHYTPTLTGSDLTHYNLTGLESHRVYTNISVQAVNSAGSSERSAVTARYNHTSPTGKSEDTHDCIHVSTDVLSISCTHTLYLQQYRSALEVHVLLSNGVGLFYLWLVPPSVTVHHFGTLWAHSHSQQLRPAFVRGSPPTVHLHLFQPQAHSPNPLLALPHHSWLSLW